MFAPASCQVEPPSTEVSSTPPSKANPLLTSKAKRCQKVSEAADALAGIATALSRMSCWSEVTPRSGAKAEWVPVWAGSALTLQLQVPDVQFAMEAKLFSVPLSKP